MIVTTLLLAAVISAGPDRADAPVLLDFHASWCGPCEQMRPIVRRLAEHKYPIKSIDHDRSPELVAKYKVTSLPTFIVVDRAGKVLARTEGAMAARPLALFYLSARNKADAQNAQLLASRPEPPAVEPAEDLIPADIQGPNDHSINTPSDEGIAGLNDLELDTEVAPVSGPINPKPWETVVRIKVKGPRGMMGFGSGTVIYSSPEESIILTCAHIFKLEGRQQAPPSRFPSPISVDLFDGKLHGSSPAQVHYAKETYDGQAIDYNFVTDVGLLRIRPGRRIPAARVVPAYWKPEADMGMIAVGCPEGQDATAWNTRIIKAMMNNVPGHQQYEAIECTTAPKQGRSGGGLFTQDGFVAGVCDFASPQDDRGLYATPRSIYEMLDRNKLMALYAPPVKNGGALLAQAKARANGSTRVRAQSQDGEITVPDPARLGILDPEPNGLRDNDAPGWTSNTGRPDRRVSRRQIANNDDLEILDDVPARLDRKPVSGDDEPTSDIPSLDSPINTEDLPAQGEVSPSGKGVSGWKAGQYRGSKSRSLIEAR